MDKYEYKVRSEEISNLIDKEKYAEAVKIADTIDWRRVKSAGMLLKIAALYRINRRNEDSREMLMLAYDRYPTNRSVVYSLCELSIELDDVVAAIEYYKQFAKLAPKDNGVYTLRYRILEAQEASLEERIEILEELKKRDYQEEWAYELAYLYHRVGLSTKCVEECDDIILWFGDGSYVMKAMELKALHVPLTEVQQKKYEAMMELSDNNYGENNYQDEEYQNENYESDNYGGQTDYAEETYGNESYGQTNYAEETYGNETYEQTGYAEETYGDGSYGQAGYAEETYGNETYEQTGYAEETYGDGSYGQAGYAEETYGNEGYAEGTYGNEPYEQAGYVDDGYGNLSYVENAYQDNSFTGEFYVEQIYDENGNPVDVSDNYETDYQNGNSLEQAYAENGYAQDGYNYAERGYNAYENTGYNDNTYNAPSYNNAAYVQQNNVAPSAGAGDMSQYNTINLQKVVAESMKELFPDDDDVFAEDREKYNSGEIIAGTIGDTRIFANAMHDNPADKKPDRASTPENDQQAADKISDMTENASDAKKHQAAPVQTGRNKKGEGMSGEPDKDSHTLDSGKPEAEISDANNTVLEITNIEISDTEISDAETLDTGTSIKNVNAVISDEKISDKEISDAYNADMQKEDVGISEPQMQTGRVAQMVTSVSEAAPEPHTGAIKKVLIPGDDARLIKAESDMDELRDTTEKTVVEEHSRMEYNEENVYRDQSFTDPEMTDEALPNQTGSMNLDDVLVEWERMKLDNAKKHQEEIKQHILTQTGKIFADFDNSIKSGILGELEREEAEAQKRNISSKNSSNSSFADNSSSGNGFLEADDTGDIPQSQSGPASEDDFDIAYISEKAETKKTEPEETEPEKMEPDPKEEYLSELERVVAQELGGLTKDIPQTIGQTMDGNQTGESISEENAVADSTAEPEMSEENLSSGTYYTDEDVYTGNGQAEAENTAYYEESEYTQESELENTGYYVDDEYLQEAESEDAGSYGDSEYLQETESEDAGSYGESEYLQETESEDAGSYEGSAYTQEAEAENAGYYEGGEYLQEAEAENAGYYEDGAYTQESGPDSIEYYEDNEDTAYTGESSDGLSHSQYNGKELDPEDVESIAEMAKEDALKTQEIKMNTADLSSLSEKIVATTKKEAKGAKREEIREFTLEEQTLFENFAVTKKIKKQIVFALDNITLAAYTGNIIITGDAGLDTVRMAKNLIKEYQESDDNFSGKLAKITGEKINQRNIKDVFEKLNNGGIIIEKANGMSEEKLYEMALNLNQEHLGIVVIMEDTKKEITKLLEKQAMIADYFNIRIDLMEMDNNALVAYAKNYALALEYSIDELGTLALYTRIANMQSGNHVVTKDEVRDIIDEAIWKSKKSKIKNFVDVLFARRYDNEDMIVLKERDFM